jgi:L-aspartate oxidase
MNHFDFCILGSGIAGLSSALFLEKYGKTCLISNNKLFSGSTPLAQGGIACIENPLDSFESHMQDTLKAGEYKNNTEAVRILVNNAPLAIEHLKKWGVQFKKSKHLEGGHSFPRIFHNNDKSGKEISNKLIKKVLDSKNIFIKEFNDVYYLNSENNYVSSYDLKNNIHNNIFYKTLIIATGGYSSLYNFSTSPQENLGTGISLAIKNDITTKDLNKIQFHPTVLNIKRSPKLLLTEALRGEGSVIIDQNNNEIVDPLNTRQKVSLAIFKSQKKGHEVFLDTRMIKNFNTKFPFLFKALTSEFNLNPQKDLLPISWGAHYCMGGIQTNLFGQTNKNNIYAIGECANTGVHGNNRLASNSLLEGVVFAKKCSDHITNNNFYNFNKNSYIKRNNLIYEKEITILNEIKNILSEYFSISRNKESIKKGVELLNKVEIKNIKDDNILCLAKQIFK